MSTDTRSICQWSVALYVHRYISRVSVYINRYIVREGHKLYMIFYFSKIKIFRIGFTFQIVNCSLIQHCLKWTAKQPPKVLAYSCKHSPCPSYFFRMYLNQSACYMNGPISKGGATFPDDPPFWNIVKKKALGTRLALDKFLETLMSLPQGKGVLPQMGYIGMCDPKG